MPNPSSFLPLPSPPAAAAPSLGQPSSTVVGGLSFTAGRQRHGRPGTPARSHLAFTVHGSASSLFLSPVPFSINNIYSLVFLGGAIGSSQIPLPATSTDQVCPPLLPFLCAKRITPNPKLFVIIDPIQLQYICFDLIDMCTPGFYAGSAASV